MLMLKTRLMIFFGLASNNMMRSMPTMKRLAFIYVVR